MLIGSLFFFKEIPRELRVNHLHHQEDDEEEKIDDMVDEKPHRKEQETDDEFRLRESHYEN